jgi:large subunit ribosomal protein L7Ae
LNINDYSILLEYSFFLKVILDEVSLTVLYMAKSYVKFEVSNDVVSKTYEALQLAKQSGTIRKGSNEVTKSVERGLASFVVIAGDVEPEEVVVHLPSLCEQKKIAYSYVPSKLDLGKSIGLNVPCTAIAVENAGSAANAIKEITAKVTGSAPSAQKQEQKPQQEKEAKPKAPKKAPAPQPAQPAQAPATQPAVEAPAEPVEAKEQ